MVNRHLGRRLRLVLAALVAATALAGGPPGWRENVERAFGEGKFEEAARLIEEHLAADPKDGDARVKLGWCRYRLGDFTAAAATFGEASRRDPASRDARVGLAYVKLQTGAAGEAASSFRTVLAEDPKNRDALRGLVLAARRQSSDLETVEAAIGAAKALLDLEPGDSEAAIGLLALEARRGGRTEFRRRPDADATRPLDIPARAGRKAIEIRRPDGSYEPVFLAGINLGAALPGKYPTEFPEDVATWRDWLDTIAGFGANVVRVYTLLPPAFYRAIAERNAAEPSSRLRLVQGVWTELPPGHDFSDPGYVKDFDAEIARVIDAVHGDLVVAPRPGHASGAYETDASGSLLAYIIGREWEPFAVEDFDARHPDDRSFTGIWFEASGGRAMECWVAKRCEFAAGYEARRYRSLHPLTFANWPTLDPLHHPTEASRSEENAFRRKLGIPFAEHLAERAWEDDAVTLDSTRIRPTAAMKAGFFAAYHVYPNFPDFLNLDPAYDGARDASGPSRYAGYLQALAAYHGDQPVVIAEFGISTSRGVAHVQPEGWNHGGHDERAQGELVARMLRAIRDTGLAGGIVFEFQDEWFKSTWSVSPFESPPERRRLWFDAESPEESYGLVANRPSGRVRVDGDPAEWRREAIVAKATGDSAANGWEALSDVSTDSDEGYVYFLLRTRGGPEPPDWSRVGYRLAIDTYAPVRGETKLPPPGPATTPTGVEFLVDIDGPGRSGVTVSEPYEPSSRREAGPIASPLEPSGRFARISLETNRQRFGRDGTRYPSIRVDRGQLRFGSLDPKAPGFDTRTDVAVGARSGAIEIRIPWGLLNVSDPSSRRVLHQVAKHAPPFDTEETDGFRIYPFVFDPSKPEAPARGLVPGRAGATPWTWAMWEKPAWRRETKLGAAAVRKAMADVTKKAEAR